MKWWEARLKTPKESSDAVAALFHEYVDIHGVVLEGPVVNGPLHPEYGESFVQGGKEDGEITIIIYLPEDISSADIRARILTVLQKVREAGLDTSNCEESINLSLVDESSWESAWKEQLHPMPVGDVFVIVPKWENYLSDEFKTRHKIVIEPGMAFGTGTHETTQMCLEAIEAFAPENKRVLDVGCGTAVLSIAAARLGAKKVIAVDIDPIAVRVAKQNVMENHLTQVVFPQNGNLLTGFSREDVFDMVCANILRDVVIALTPEVMIRLSKGGVFISSGYISNQVEMVHQAFRKANLQIGHVFQKGDWVCTVAVKPA